eukprot:scaffold16692_cov91-Isochrysis_galbana.AAC.3
MVACSGFVREGFRRRKECKCPILMGRREEVQVCPFVNRFAIGRDPDRQPPGFVVASAYYQLTVKRESQL